MPPMTTSVYGKTALENNTWGDWGNQGFHTMMGDEHQLPKRLSASFIQIFRTSFTVTAWAPMIARDFMTKYGEELTGATICGTCGVFPDCGGDHCQNRQTDR